MYTTLNDIEFCQADVVNQDDAFLHNGNFFLVYDDEEDFVVGGCFASSSMDALDTLANHYMLEHRMMARDLVGNLDIGQKYDYLGNEQVPHYIHGLHIAYTKVNMDVTHILEAEGR